MGTGRDLTIGMIAATLGSLAGGVGVAVLGRAGAIDSVVSAPRRDCPREDNDALTNYGFMPSVDSEVILEGEDEGVNGEVSFMICRDPARDRPVEFWYFGRNQSRQSTLRPAAYSLERDRYETRSDEFPSFFVDPGSCEFGFVGAPNASPESYFCD